MLSRKLILLQWIGVFVLGMSSSAFALKTYTIDPFHTEVTWQVSHADFSYPTGKFMSINGKIYFDDQDMTKSYVTLTIPVAQGMSGVTKIDELLLKGVDFFYVDKFANATFKSTRVEKIDDHKLKVIGDLTLVNVTKPVTLFVRINKHGLNILKEDTIGFSAQATLKRSDFGMTKSLPSLSDEVKLSIEVEANE